MATRKIARRLRRAPGQEVLGREVAVATGFALRLLGLALLDIEHAGAGLLIPRCRSVHTIGMRFALDLYFLDAAGRPTSVSLGVPPNRIESDRRAVAVLELPAGAEPAGRGEDIAAPDALPAACCRREKRLRPWSSARTTSRPSSSSATT